jgi:hypothetical protein
MDELDELRTKIANTKGYRVAVVGLSYATLYEPGDTLPENAEVLDMADYLDSVPDWSSDLVAAWDLVEEMNEAGCPVDVRSFVDGTATCIVDDKLRSVGETVPEAICKAWIAYREAVRQEAQP